jgi:putative alpha-1,2-mannosidase
MLKLKYQIICFAVSMSCSAQQSALVDLVNPLVNTSGCRFDFFASASVPFGMVALSPDTRHGDLWKAGYQWNNEYILNFSHILKGGLLEIELGPKPNTKWGNN